QPQARAELADDDVGRELKNHIRHEEDHRDEGVAVANGQPQVGVHAGDARIGQVDAVDERERVDAREDGQEADVDFAHDAACFGRFFDVVGRA
nr:hypothetical protein [Tanacetum cinerariifolium]